MDTRTLSATVTHTHEGRTWRIAGPTPTVPDADSDPQGIEDVPTAEGRAQLAAWCTALAHDVPGIPDDATWWSSTKISYEPQPADVEWGHIWSMALNAEAVDFQRGTITEVEA